MPHLFLSCFPEAERSWVPSEQHPTLIAALEREADSVFPMPRGEDSLTEVGEDVEWMEPFPCFTLVLGAAGSKRHSREDHAILQCQLLQKEAKTRVLQVQVLAELWNVFKPASMDNPLQNGLRIKGTRTEGAARW